jgi:hypothetical protein
MTNPYSRTTIGPLLPVSSYSIVPADSAISGMRSPLLSPCTNRSARQCLLSVVVCLCGSQGLLVHWLVRPVFWEQRKAARFSSLWRLSQPLKVRSPLKVLFSFSARSYCKRKMILCANEEVEHGFMALTSSLLIWKPDCRDWSPMRAWHGMLGFMPECL